MEQRWSQYEKLNWCFYLQKLKMILNTLKKLNKSICESTTVYICLQAKLFLWIHCALPIYYNLDISCKFFIKDTYVRDILHPVRF